MPRKPCPLCRQPTVEVTRDYAACCDRYCAYVAPVDHYYTQIAAVERREATMDEETVQPCSCSTPLDC